MSEAVRKTSSSLEVVDLRLLASGTASADSALLKWLVEASVSVRDLLGRGKTFCSDPGEELRRELTESGLPSCPVVAAFKVWSPSCGPAVSTDKAGRFSLEGSFSPSLGLLR